MVFLSGAIEPVGHLKDLIFGCSADYAVIPLESYTIYQDKINSFTRNDFARSDIKSLLKSIKFVYRHFVMKSNVMISNNN